MSDPADVKEALARLARRTADASERATAWSRRDGDYRAVVDRACSAVESLDAAAAYLESTELDDLESAVDRARAADDHAAARRGERALDALRAARASARDGDHFHSDHGTALRTGGDNSDK